MAVFSKSNLSASSVQWGREVQQRIESIESEMSSLMVNDRSATKQLQDSYRRLDETVNGLLLADQNIIAAQADADTAISNAAAAASAAGVAAADAAAAAADAQDAIDGLVSLGTSNSLYDINANNITAGTLTGRTVQTASGGQRVVMSGTSNSIYFYDVNGDQVGYMNGGGSGREGELILTGPATNYGVAFSSANTNLYGAGQSVNLTSQGISLGGNVYADGSYYAGTVSQAIIGPSGGVYPTNGNSTTGETVIQAGSSGILRRYGTSSRRYKNSETNIWESNTIDPYKLLEVPVKVFKYNEGYLAPDDQNYGKFIPGLMAEDLDVSYPAASYYKDGLVENWMDRPVLVGTLALVQKLYEKIDALESRLAILEGN